ncbi:MAG: ArnT family glycosyltransferase [Chloroflexota bacterium]
MTTLALSANAVPGKPPRRSVMPFAQRGILLVAIFAAYAYGATTNPPGFYLDEASIAYNADTISVDGRDEHGVAWPLFFQTWDPTAAINPVYVYLLAAVFKVFGPSILAARLLSLVLGFIAAVLIGVLVARATRDTRAGIVVGAMAVVTPWLFEISRLVFEVALFPLALVGFLLVLQAIQDRPRWPVWGVAALAVLLAIVTYTYTIGRVLGPLLGFGLIVFATRRRARDLAAVWVLYGVSLVPALVFNLRSGGALGARADLVGYIRPGMSPLDVAGQFVGHLAGNLSLERMLLLGDANIRHHVPVTGSLLLGTFLLALLGLVLIAREQWRDPWARYVVYGLVVSLIPASLTADDFHTLRLIGFPVFLLLIAGTGAAALLRGAGRRRGILVALVALTALQAAWFFVQFWRIGPDRGYAFDTDAPGALRAALSTGATPIYLRDKGDVPGYIESYWYAATAGIDRSRFVRLRNDEVPPAGVVVVGTETACGRCDVIRNAGGYVAYRAGAPTGAGVIPNSDFEAIGSTPLGEFGADVFGWSGSSDVAIFPGGARTPGAHLVLAHRTAATSAAQSSSAVAAVKGGEAVGMSGSFRGTSASGSPLKATLALVELDHNHAFVAWHPTTFAAASSGQWEDRQFDSVTLDPSTEFVSVSCYLEPGGAVGDQIEIDDIVVAVR